MTTAAASRPLVTVTAAAGVDGMVVRRWQSPTGLTVTNKGLEGRAFGPQAFWSEYPTGPDGIIVAPITGVLATYLLEERDIFGLGLLIDAGSLHAVLFGVVQVPRDGTLVRAGYVIGHLIETSPRLPAIRAEVRLSGEPIPPTVRMDATARSGRRTYVDPERIWWIEEALGGHVVLVGAGDMEDG